VYAPSSEQIMANVRQLKTVHSDGS